MPDPARSCDSLRTTRAGSRARGPADPLGARTSTTAPTFAPINAAPSGESGDASDGRDLDLHLLTIAVLDLDDRADADVVVGLVLDRDRVMQPVLEDVDAALQETLFVLRRVILEVLGDVAELTGALDRLDDLAATRALGSASSVSSAVRWSEVRCSARCSFTEVRLDARL